MKKKFFGFIVLLMLIGIINQMHKVSAGSVPIIVPVLNHSNNSTDESSLLKLAESSNLDATKLTNETDIFQISQLTLLLKDSQIKERLYDDTNKTILVEFNDKLIQKYIFNLISDRSHLLL